MLSILLETTATQKVILFLVIVIDEQSKVISATFELVLISNNYHDRVT